MRLRSALVGGKRSLRRYGSRRHFQDCRWADKDPGRSRTTTTGAPVSRPMLSGGRGPEPKATPLRRPSMTHWRVGTIRPRPHSATRPGPAVPTIGRGRGRSGPLQGCMEDRRAMPRGRERPQHSVPRDQCATRASLFLQSPQHSQRQ